MKSNVLLLNGMFSLVINAFFGKTFSSGVQPIWVSSILAIPLLSRHTSARVESTSTSHYRSSAKGLTSLFLNRQIQTRWGLCPAFSEPSCVSTRHFDHRRNIGKTIPAHLPRGHDLEGLLLVRVLPFYPTCFS